MNANKKVNYCDRMFPIQEHFSCYYRGNASIESAVFSLVEEMQCGDVMAESFDLMYDDEISIEEMSISPVQRSLLQFLISTSQSKTILEIGTFIGLSALYMSCVLPNNGKIITIEKFDRFADIAKENFRRNKCDDKITLLRGDALLCLKDIQGPVDFVFLDGDKSHYKEYFQQIDKLLSPKGILLVDDVFFQGDVLNAEPTTEKGLGVRLFLEYVKERQDYSRTLLPLDNGMLILRKRHGK